MTIAKLTNLNPTSTGYQVDPQRPILARALEIQGAHRVVSHSHPRAQLVYAIQGVVRVRTMDGTWIVAPQQAVWVPPNVEHEVIANDSISIRTLFIDPSATTGLPESCCVLNIPPLLRELILRAMEVGDNYIPDSSGYRIMQVILDLLQELQPAPLYLPMGRDKRLLQIMDSLSADPADERSLDDWADISGASARTLARLFIRETGMNFGDWRKQLRLLEAIDRLGQGHSVTRVAIELGYKSSSAFIAMFRKSLGVSPGAYISGGEEA
jgi:AraC-like DNA-binding protein